MADVDDLTATIRNRLSTVSSYAATIARNPRSTIEPPRSSGDELTRRAIAAWRALAAVPSSDGLAFERTIGEGGMGVVHLAEQVALGRKVAVKTLRDGVDDRDAVLKLLREAWITGALEHPNVVPVYDVALDARGGPLIVLKRIEGVAWLDVMHAPEEIERRFGATDALEWNLRILQQVCRAAHFAHARSVVHRDLKPENVMIGAFGEVYVLDWGIAVALHDDGTGRFPLASEAHEMAGTPAYMAPEMLGGEAARLGPRSDVYLLGAILHELLVGHPPHEGTELHAVVSSIVVSEPKLPDSVPSALARVVRRAMARAPEDRFESADELRLALDEFLRHRGSMRLCEHAGRSLARLQEVVVASTGAATKPAHRRDLYNLLGECRFGYRAALVEHPQNDEAKEGLAAALEAVAGWELAQGDPDSAALLVDELDPKPPSLVARLEEARARKAAERAHLERLHALGRDLDKSAGARTRVFIASVMGALWITAPLLRIWIEATRTSYAGTIGWNVGMIALTIGLWVWARESMLKTAVNRRLMATLLLTFVGQTVLNLGMLLAGGPPPLSNWLHMLIWALMVSTVAIHVERALAFAAAAAFGAFLVVARWPAALYPAQAIVNATIVGNMVYVWLPRGAARSPDQG